jgi:hypothetical protein
MAASGVWSTCSRPSASVFAGRCSLRHSMLCESRPWTNSRERFSPPITIHARNATCTACASVQHRMHQYGCVRGAGAGCTQKRSSELRSTRPRSRCEINSVHSKERCPIAMAAVGPPLIGLRFSSAALHTQSALLSSEALWSTIAMRVTGPGSVPSPHHPGGWLCPIVVRQGGMVGPVRTVAAFSLGCSQRLHASIRCSSIGLRMRPSPSHAVTKLVTRRPHKPGN